MATGTGVFLLLSGKAELIGTTDEEKVREAMGAIGAFGCLFTLGLFAFEMFGIKKCHYLIEAGRRLERDLGVRGQFRCRPLDAAGFVNEPMASSVVYPVSMAAWTFLALVFVSQQLHPEVVDGLVAVADARVDSLQLVFSGNGSVSHGLGRPSQTARPCARPRAAQWARLRSDRRRDVSERVDSQARDARSGRDAGARVSFQPAASVLIILTDVVLIS